MLTALYLLTNLFILSVPLAHANTCSQFTKHCVYNLCDTETGLPPSSVYNLILPPPWKETKTPLICRRTATDKFRHVIRTGEPIIVLPDGKELPLHKWRPKGLSHPFRQNFFFTANVLSLGKSSITRRRFIGNQMLHIRNACIRLPVTLLRNKSTRGTSAALPTRYRTLSSCISFRAHPVALLIELEWENNDNLNLYLTEPGGTVVNKFYTTSPTTGAKLTKDIATDACFSRRILVAKEQISYQNSFPTGTYTVIGRHYANCYRRPTRWRLRVIAMDDVILSETSLDNGDFSAVMFNFKFVV